MSHRSTSARSPQLAFCALFVSAMVALGCGSEARGPASDKGRVILIGIDGASPLVTGPMMGSGRLPNLTRIAKEGVYGRLRSLPPLFSPRIWNTIGTGKLPEEHGIKAFVRKDESGRKRLYDSHDRRVPGLWNILSEAGIEVGVVNWWTTYPPEEISGVMVSDHFFPEQISMIKNTFHHEGPASAGALVHPPEWQNRAEALIADGRILTPFEDPFAGNDALPHWINRDVLSSQYQTDNDVARVALAIQEEFSPQAMMVFLPGIDRVSHWLWGCLEPDEKYPEALRPTPEAKLAGAEALRHYYAFTDALIGLLIAGYGPDDLVLVVSDHGFEAGVTLMLLTGTHDSPAAFDGVVYARGRGVPAGERAGRSNVLHVAPSVINWFGLPIAKDMKAGPAPFFALPPPTAIASYDATEVRRMEVESAGREEEIVEHLRALGYLDESRGGGEVPVAPLHSSATEDEAAPRTSEAAKSTP